MAKNRSRQYTRMQERAHIAKKKRIVKNVYYWAVYEHDHQYSKNKIHCSCPLCRFEGPTYSDMKKNARDKYAYTEYNKYGITSEEKDTGLYNNEATE